MAHALGNQPAGFREPPRLAPKGSPPPPPPPWEWVGGDSRRSGAGAGGALAGGGVGQRPGPAVGSGGGVPGPGVEAGPPGALLRRALGAAAAVTSVRAGAERKAPPPRDPPSPAANKSPRAAAGPSPAPGTDPARPGPAQLQVGAGRGAAAGPRGAEPPPVGGPGPPWRRLRGCRSCRPGAGSSPSLHAAASPPALHAQPSPGTSPGVGCEAGGWRLGAGGWSWGTAPGVGPWGGRACRGARWGTSVHMTRDAEAKALASDRVNFPNLAERRVGIEAAQSLPLRMPNFLLVLISTLR